MQEKSQNIAFVLRQMAQEKRDEIALVEARSGKSYSFAYIEQRSDELAHVLQDQGVKAGDRVILMVKPGAEFICLTFALFKLGAPVILIDPGMGYKNVVRCIGRVQPKIFIGIVQACIFRILFRKTFATVCKSYVVDVPFAKLWKKRSSEKREMFSVASTRAEDLAAIIFTTGSTGPPKGVCYEHGIFAAQLEHIDSYYGIGGSDCDQPAFPLFALFSIALGARVVIPDMDVTRPARVNPVKFIDSIGKNKVTYSFGSPALWRVISAYCSKNDIVLHSLKKVLMAGAPVSGELIEKTFKILPDDAEIHVPYGATEALPIVSADGWEIVNTTWENTVAGKGSYVGRPLPGSDVKIIEATEYPMRELDETLLLPVGEIGEIIVAGDVVTKTYDHDEEETRMAKLHYAGKMYHRMGDMGYTDTSGRIWFCGRKAHRVKTVAGIKYTIPCEAIINNHPEVYRSALVGIPDSSYAIPVIIVELERDAKRDDTDQILSEIKALAATSELTRDIEYFLVHPQFPVDIRHNAKIFREKLTVWAERKIKIP